MSNETGVVGVKGQPEVVNMARKGMKVECGHCNFVARTAAAMEEHMKEHDTVTSDAYPGDTSYSTIDTLYSTEQEHHAAGCQDVDSFGTSSEELHGETNPTQDGAYEHFKDGVLYEPSETQLDSMQDRLEDEQVRVKCEHTSNAELSRSDSNQRCLLKITEVRSITEETESYSGDDQERDCSTDTQFQIMPVRSIKQEPEFQCKKEPVDDQEATPQMTFIQFGDLGARSDSVCPMVAPIAVKQEPGWVSYHPVSSGHIDMSFPAEKKESIDVVGFGDADSDVDSETDCERSLTEAVQLSLWRIKRRRRNAEKESSSQDVKRNGEASCDLKDRVSSFSAVAPNLFAALTEPDAETPCKTTASDSEHDDKKPFDHQDHTYADTGRPGSLTCARVRTFDEVIQSARKTRHLRRRRAPTSIVWPQEIYAAAESPKTVNKRKSPNNISAILEALSPIKNSYIGDTARTPDAAADLPSRGGSPRRPTPKSAVKALSFTSESSLYVCAICHISFVTRTAFCSHVINCHKEVGGRLYYCAYCTYVAMDMGLVKSHMDEVHGNHATRVIAAGLDTDMRAEKDHKEPVPTFVQIRVSDRVQRRNENAQSKAHINPGAFVEAAVTRKRKKPLKKSSDLQSKRNTAVTSVSYPSNRKARKSQSLEPRRTRYISPEKHSYVGIEKSPSSTPSSCVQSPDCWQEYPDDNDLDDCVPELVDDTCCEMFENSFLSLEWDQRETLGRTLYSVSDPFETANDASGKVVAVKQEPLSDAIVDSSNCEQGSRRYSRRTRKPKRPHCMCGSCDEEYTISPTGEAHETFSRVDRAKTLDAAAGDISCDSLLLSEVSDKMVGMAWEEDPKLKMTPIVRLCDIVMAIVAGGGGYT